jgi:hypothetical protein
MLAFFTLMLTPVMGIYMSYENLDGGTMGFINLLSLGNLGGS